MNAASIVDVIDAEPMPTTIPVKKQVWNGKEFVLSTLYRQQGQLSDEQRLWLSSQFGRRGARWDYSLAGNFYTMDEQVYAWFQLKWGKT